MNLDQLFKVQQIMENNIKKLSQIDEDALGKDNVFDLRFLALQVKVGELANLTKCYKYSKTKEDISKDKLMIRYIDAMKYLLSIGNENNFSIISIDSINSVAKKESIIKAFGEIFDDITHLKYNIQHNNFIDGVSRYIKLFGEFINLGDNLGFTFEEVYSYYIEMSPCTTKNLE